MSSSPQRPFRRYLSKTPRITVFFWVAKVLASLLGWLLVAAGGLELSVATMLVATLLAVATIAQFAVARYVPWLYWLYVTLIGMFGALLVGNLTDIFDVSPETCVVVFLVLLAAGFLLWYATERTVSVHTVDTARRETFYWVTITLTFALGTAAALRHGDTLFVAATLLALAAIFRRAGAVAFWVAYVVTQPLTVAAGHLLDRDLGAAPAILLALVATAGAVAYLSLTHRDDPSLETATRHVPCA